MTNQEWIDGVFTESETDYKIAGMNLLYKNEEDYLVKGVELLYDELNPTSVLEFGFGKGWTATEFQKCGVTRHVILEPNKENYSTDIDILNVFSWQFETDEKFDLVYDDRFYFKNEKHYEHMDKILPIKQWYASNALQDNNKEIADYPIFFQIDNINYVQSLSKYGEYKKWQQ